ncbi:DUF1800 domain-containing protein [Roseiterribacter gracilis]|uniref:DUF1800 domain-containing protein n=1 Tax=Roseiterribacter gracilis TaxID=2812848 RepID=UPI003B43463A
MPDQSRLLLNRVTYGATPLDLYYIGMMGPTAWLDAQLAAPIDSDGVSDAALAAATIPIRNAAGETEQRGLTALYAPISDLWPFIAQSNNTEINRVVQETRAAAWIRSATSPFQLREKLVEFWTDHFNVNASTSNQTAVSYAAYIRVIRANALGNFRAMLEGVASSTAMLYYLSNQSSRATTPNENFAREMMELHTLGVSNYYEFTTPPMVNGIAAGYTDLDVVTAAKALSGWTVENGSRAGNRTLPNTGNFVFVSEFHNTETKKILGVTLKQTSDPQSEARQLFDMLASHTGTAQFLASKLAKRFVSDTPPQSVIDAGAATFQARNGQATQIADTLRAILTHPDALQISGVKLKRPFEQIIGVLRVTGAAANPQPAVASALDATGYTQYGWGAPNGLPDTAGYWLTTNTTLRTWNLLQTVLSTTSYGTLGALRAQMSASDLSSGQAALDFWLNRLLGYRPDDTVYQALMSDTNSSAGYGTKTTAAATTQETALRRMVALIAATTNYVYR